MSTFDISTFVSNNAEIKTALESGATHLILDHPDLSIRTYSKTRLPLVDTILSLSQYALKLDPSIQLSLNLDMLVHDQHFPMVESCLKHISDSSIHSIRIQDPGLISLIQELSPHKHVHLCTDTGNNNIHSASFYSPMVQRQILTNELPFIDIRSIIHHVPSEFELQVHGPILIQYSKRKFQTDYLRQSSGDHDLSGPRTAIDLEMPKREFLFNETTHGHFMYAHFDRCLINHIDRLMALPLSSWLIDCRGYSHIVMKEVISAYVQELSRFYQDDSSSWTPSFTLMDHLTSLIQRPLKPGFFLANRTDSDWRNQKPSLSNQFMPIGKVVNVIKNKSLIVECTVPIHRHDVVCIVTPEFKRINTKLTALRDINDQDINQSIVGQFINLNPLKGVCAGSTLYRKTT